MPEDEETPGAPGWLGDGILQDGRDPGFQAQTADFFDALASGSTDDQAVGLGSRF